MAMTAGTVVIADDGGETKSGAAGSLYDLLFAQTTTDLAAKGQAFPAGSDGATIKRALAATANVFGSWLVTYVTTNGQAKIPNSAAGDGLVRTPNPNTADTDCKRPSADKFLTIV